MENPKPINLTSDDHWRELGWPAVARDADGHVISVCCASDHASFTEWLAECKASGFSVTDLKGPKRPHLSEPEGRAVSTP